MSLGPDARALLNAAADGDEPSDADMARVRSKLGARLALGAAAGATAVTATKAASGAAAATVPMTSLLGVKLGVAVFLLAAAGATAAVVTHEDARGASRTTAPLAVEQNSRAAATPTTPSTEADLNSASAILNERTASAQPTAAITASAAEPPPARTAKANATADPIQARSTAPGSTEGGGNRPVSPPVGAAGSASTVSRTTASSTSALAVADSAPARTGTRETPTQVATAVMPPPRDTVAEEASLLRAANGALARNDGKTALARVDEHTMRFPNGALTEEREATRVFALCALGRVADSRTAAASFVATRPRSPLAAQVRRTCTTAP